jgi:CRP-like cAMP-binding protein/DNA-binding NarL/FixJ family response regulator
MNYGSILVVEDERLVANEINNNLVNHGYTVVGISDTGEDAVSIASSKFPDLVLMDIKLKGSTDGIDTAKIIKTKLGIPVVFLTSYADDATLNKLKTVKPDGYVVKPFLDFELKAAIELAMNNIDKEKLERNRSARAIHESIYQSAPKNEDSNQYSVKKYKARQYRGVDEASPENEDNSDILSKEQEDILYFLKTRCDIFDNLHSSDQYSNLHTIVRESSVASYKSSQVVFNEGESSFKKGCFIVLEGRVKLIKNSPNGKEIILNILTPGDAYSFLFGIADLPYNFVLKAHSHCKVLWIPFSALIEYFSNTSTLQSLLSKVSNLLFKSQELSRSLAHDKVELRIATQLVDLIPKFNDYIVNSVIVIDSLIRDSVKIPLTRHELADYIGTTPETAIRVTKAMERKGLLDLSKPGIIDIKSIDKLKKYVEKLITE